MGRSATAKKKLRIYSFGDGYVNESRHYFVILTISTLITKNNVSLSVYTPLYKPMSTSNLKHNEQQKKIFSQLFIQF